VNCPANLEAFELHKDYTHAAERGVYVQAHHLLRQLYQVDQSGILLRMEGGEE
jgi:hypothetical protein